MKHLPLKRKTGHKPVFIPMGNIGDLPKPTLPRKFFTKVHEIPNITWEFEDYFLQHVQESQQGSPLQQFSLQ